MRALDDQLFTAAEGGDAAAVVRLAGEGASADAKQYGEPAVLVAANDGHTEAVEALLRLGCDPNAPDRGGNTALMWAARWGRGGIVGALLEHGGAELDAADNDGVTALMGVALKGQAAVAAQLVEAGADATLRATGGDEWEGKTALEIAEARGHAEVAALLRQLAEEPEPEPEPEVEPEPEPRQATAEQPQGSAQAESEAARAARAARQPRPRAFLP